MNRRRIVLVLVFVVLAGAGWWLWKMRAARAHGEGTFYGNVDIREVDLGFRVAGRIEKIFKDEGDTVKAGDVLAVLDAQPFQNQLDQAKANLASLTAVRDLKRHGYRPEEISQAEATMLERQATLENAEIELKRQKELLASRTASRKDFDNAEAQFRESRARFNSAQQNLRLLKAGFRAEEIAQAEADVARAEAAVHIAEKDLLTPRWWRPRPGSW